MLRIRLFFANNLTWLSFLVGLIGITCIHASYYDEVKEYFTLWNNIRGFGVILIMYASIVPLSIISLSDSPTIYKRVMQYYKKENRLPAIPNQYPCTHAAFKVACEDIEKMQNKK